MIYTQKLIHDNANISENLHNSSGYDYTISGINYAISGIVAHFAGVVIEVISIPFLQVIPYLNWIKIPIAKVLHEVGESFISSSATINLKDGNGLLDAVIKITEPIWKHPSETVTAGVFSFVFEQVITVQFSLQKCNHHHNHQHAVKLLSLDNIIKGLASAVGSYFGSYCYKKAEYYAYQLFGINDGIDKELENIIGESYHREGKIKDLINIEVNGAELKLSYFDNGEMCILNESINWWSSLDQCANE
jgi:hypothetical protein